LAQGGESFDFAQDREPVENPELVEVVERLVEPFEIWFLVLGISTTFLKGLTLLNLVEIL
jgi:hypothetical protein